LFLECSEANQVAINCNACNSRNQVSQLIFVSASIVDWHLVRDN
jgi:hypothetical protein